MTELPFNTSPDQLKSALKELHTDRRANKVTSKRKVLKGAERRQVLEKTDGRCHVCGAKITGSFHADHVKSHSSGGDHNVSNYLPSCNTCNNYRWHYNPQEIQWILKLGVWIKTEITKGTFVGNSIATAFIAHEKRREIRRRRPRQYLHYTTQRIKLWILFPKLKTGFIRFIKPLTKKN